MEITYGFSPFRKEYHKMVKDGLITSCPFCAESDMESQAIRSQNGEPVENEFSRWVINKYPYSDGHTLVVPKRHISSIHDMSRDEIISHHEMIRFAADTLQKLYPDAGIETFLQYGKGSRMSLPHLHTHVVLALPTDTYRGMQKLGYFEAFEEDEEKIIMLPVKVTLVREKLIEALAKVIDLSELAKYTTAQ